MVITKCPRHRFTQPTRSKRCRSDRQIRASSGAASPQWRPAPLATRCGWRACVP